MLLRSSLAALLLLVPVGKIYAGKEWIWTPNQKIGGHEVQVRFGGNGPYNVTIVVEKKPNDPPIFYRDVKVVVSDANGTSRHVSMLYPKAEVWEEIVNGGTGVFGYYIVHRTSEAPPAKVDVSIFGGVATFVLKKQR